MENDRRRKQSRRFVMKSGEPFTMAGISLPT